MQSTHVASTLYFQSSPIAVASNKVSTDVTFGAELYRIRLLAGLSQVEVARESGLARGYYSQIENSKKPPPLATVKRITAALNLSNGGRSRLLRLAVTARGASLVAPKDLPNDVVTLMRALAQKAYRLSPRQLQEIAAVIAKEPTM